MGVSVRTDPVVTVRTAPDAQQQYSVSPTRARLACAPRGEGAQSRCSDQHDQSAAALSSQSSPPYAAFQRGFAIHKSLGVVAGSELILIAVELWSDGIRLRVTVDAGAQRDDYEGGSTEIVSTIRQALDATIRITDDSDTTYTVAGRSSGGSTRERLAEWHFRPAVPGGTTRVWVALEADPAAALSVHSEAAISLERRGSRSVRRARSRAFARAARPQDWRCADTVSLLAL
jgi:hypothetical protein